MTSTLYKNGTVVTADWLNAVDTLLNTPTVSYPSIGIVSSTGTGWGTSYSTTGSGTTIVLANSPTLVTPNLDTPSTITLTNGTGLPLSTGVVGSLPISKLAGGVNASNTTFLRGDNTWSIVTPIITHVSGIAVTSTNGGMFSLENVALSTLTVNTSPVDNEEFFVISNNGLITNLVDFGAKSVRGSSGSLNIISLDTPYIWWHFKYSTSLNIWQVL